MLSKINQWIDKFDDEFVKEISSAEGRQKRIQLLQRTRVNLFIFSIVIWCMFIGLFVPFYIAGGILFWLISGGREFVFLLIICLLIFLSMVVSSSLGIAALYSVADSQIKMLLLHEKAQTE